MSIEIETTEAIASGHAFIKELQDILDATESASGDNNSAVGHNAKRSAANDGINVTRNVLRRLGALPVEAKTPEQPEQPPASEAMLDQLEKKHTNLEKAIQQNGNARDAVIEGEPTPPESIADLFQSDRPLAPQAKALQALWVKLGHQVQRGEATDDERAKHQRLTSEIDFINKHAFDGV